MAPIPPPLRLPLSKGLSVIGLLKMLAVSFVCARSTMTEPLYSRHLTMIFENRNLTDGETVPVVASREEVRKEVFVVCVARRVFDDVSLVFPVYAQNAIILDVRPEDCDSIPHKQEDVVFGCKKITLETGGFLKLRCVLRHPHHTEEIGSVTANFTFTHIQQSTTAVPRPVTTSLLHNKVHISREEEPNSVSNDSYSSYGVSRQHLSFSLVTVIIISLVPSIVKLFLDL